MSSNSDCSTKTQKHLVLTILQTTTFLTSVCAVAGPVSNYPGKLQPWPTLCSEYRWAPKEGKAQRADRLTKKGYFHSHDIGTFTSVATLYEKWGPREQYSFNMYFDILEMMEVIRARKMGEGKVPVPAKLLF